MRSDDSSTSSWTFSGMSQTGDAPPMRRLSWSSPILLLSLVLASYLPWVAADQSQSAADFYVSSLPGAPEPLLQMYAGHIEVTPEHHGNLFFWLFKNRHIANRQRTVIWINGGPGCSSMDGALMEIGPYRVGEKGKLSLNDGSWDEFANVLFVDNPVGTGFSYVDGDSYVQELQEMADQMIIFLEKWFKIFPEYSANDLYIAGESYAGQHIPYIAQAILDRNAKQDHGAWNLSGLLIGNGWISGPEQYSSYIPFAYEAGLFSSGSNADKAARKQEDECMKILDQGGKDKVDVIQCEQIMQVILKETADGGKCVNMYDTRLKDSWPQCGSNWPQDLATVTPYLRRDDVIEALNINEAKKSGWTECDSQVGGAFQARKSKPSKSLLPGLLEKMPIILFSGDQDLICNHIGTENLINKLKWGGGTGMELSPGMTAPKQDWTVDGEAAGTWQTARNLTYIRFYNSSHMVPFDYPRRTRDMLDRFLGVDIASIGGEPTDSRIGGEKGLETSVGGHPNSTAAQEAEKDKLQAATWAAYRRSAETALVVVVIAVILWGFFIWRERRRRRGYKGVLGTDPYDGPGSSGLGLDNTSMRSRRGKEDRDIEAAAAFDESELDDMSLANGSHDRKSERERFVVDDDDEEDADLRSRRSNGRPS